MRGDLLAAAALPHRPWPTQCVRAPSPLLVGLLLLVLLLSATAASANMPLHPTLPDTSPSSQGIGMISNDTQVPPGRTTATTASKYSRDEKVLRKLLRLHRGVPVGRPPIHPNQQNAPMHPPPPGVGYPSTQLLRPPPPKHMHPPPPKERYAPPPNAM